MAASLRLCCLSRSNSKDRALNTASLPHSPAYYWIELATLENALLAFEPMSLTVPTTSTRMTASITAYSAMSWPSSFDHRLQIS